MPTAHRLPTKILVVDNGQYTPSTTPPSSSEIFVKTNAYAEAAIQRFSEEKRNKLGRIAIEIAEFSWNTDARSRILQYLPKERERFEQERPERERSDKKKQKQATINRRLSIVRRV